MTGSVVTLERLDRPQEGFSINNSKHIYSARAVYGILWLLLSRAPDLWFNFDPLSQRCLHLSDSGKEPLTEAEYRGSGLGLAAGLVTNIAQAKASKTDLLCLGLLEAEIVSHNGWVPASVAG